MAKKTVTLPRRDWQLVYQTFCGNPPVGDTEAQGRRIHLWQYLTTELERVNGDPVGIRLTSPQRRMLLQDMERPMTPWRTDALVPRIWPIKEAFGWQRPDLSEYDDEENDDDES